MAEGQRRVHILVIPYPAQGHMLPLLDLASLLSDRFRLVVTVAVTQGNLPLLSPFLSRSPAVSTLVLPFPENSSLPQGFENTMYLSRPQFGLLHRALGGLHGPILRWARARPDPPDAVLSDFFVGWTARLAAELGVPRLVFSPSGAFALAVMNSLWRRMPQRSDVDDPNELVAFPSIPGSPVYRWCELSTLWRSYKRGDPDSEFIREGMLANLGSWGLVVNTFSDLEGTYLDHLRNEDLGNPRVWAVGPLAPSHGTASAAERGGPVSVPAEKVAAWLNGCEEGSVVYVAFGSQAMLSPPAAAALAAGLERSGARFVWAARAGTAVPEVFEERAAGRGLVIRGWAPQVAILGHPAVGSFVTHCGWNSVMEAAAAGVALLAWPMGADQFTNAQLLVEAGVGVRVCDGGPTSVPDPDELARAVAESVGEPGRERRERAKVMATRTMQATTAGGSSYKDLVKLVGEVSKLVTM
ncbi:unnamed protein product [Musa acuminata subsp. burmannicoides]